MLKKYMWVVGIGVGDCMYVDFDPVRYLRFIALYSRLTWLFFAGQILPFYAAHHFSTFRLFGRIQSQRYGREVP